MSHRLVAAAAEMERADLVTLATVHQFLEAIGRHAHAPVQVVALASDTAASIHKIVLEDPADPVAALDRVRAAVASLAEMIAPGGSAAHGSAASIAADAMGQSANSIPLVAEAPYSAEDLPLLTEFLVEAGGHLEAAEAALLGDAETADPAESIAIVFRCFHSIKGVAGFLNLAQIGLLAHAAENVLDRVRAGKLPFDARAIDLSLASLDAMKRLLLLLQASLKQQAAMPAWPPLTQLIAELDHHAAGEVAANNNARRDVAESSDRNASRVITASSNANAPRDNASPLSVVAPALPLAATPPAVQAANRSPAPSPAEATPPTLTAPVSEIVADAGVRVSTQRLDEMISQVGELVVAQASAAQDIAALARTHPRLATQLRAVGTIARQLQDLTLGMRMMPLTSLFQKMNRLVRDLARREGKEIELKTIGRETELDRKVIDAMADPLMHMIRNAIDHGIELPDDRIRAGKPRHGTIELRARHEAGQIVIEIVDDGRGLDAQRILAKAIERGLVAPGATMSEADIFRLIFAAGLSTSDKVSDLSGRGVGMDVVRTNIESIRGRIDLSSSPGHGCVFKIRLPLTLAVIDGLVIRVGAERWVIPLANIEQMIRPDADQMTTLAGQAEMLLVRGSVLPVHRLSRLFNSAALASGSGVFVIVQDHDRRACWAVDELLGREQVVIKSLGVGLPPVPGVSGCTILGDGQMSLIIDVPGLLDHAFKHSERAAA